MHHGDVTQKTILFPAWGYDNRASAVFAEVVA
jgi:hypothetical protein